MARTWVVMLCSLFCAQIYAAQPHQAPKRDPKADEYAELVDQLMHGKPQERVHAKFRIYEAGGAMNGYLTKECTLKRPAMPQSFAARFRGYLLGQQEVQDALQMSIHVVNPQHPTDIKSFAVWAKSVGNAAELKSRLLQYPHVAGASQENTDALVSLLKIDDKELQNLVLVALGRFSSFTIAEDQIKPFLKANELPAFIGAARMLARQNSASVVDAVLNRMRTEPLILAGLFAPVFADCDVAALVPKFRELLQDPDPRMQTVAAGYLLALDDSKDAAAAKLVELLDARNPEAQLGAAWALYEFGTDKHKETARAKINAAKGELLNVYLGAETLLGGKADAKKRVQDCFAHCPSPVGTGTWAIHVRDALRLGVGDKFKESIRGYANVLIQEYGALTAWAKQPAAKKKDGFKFRNEDRYTYSILATVLSELDPDAYQKAIETCVAAIQSRQLGCGLWSYRDATVKEQEDFGDGYDSAAATDYEFPQAYYALAGLESAITLADVKVDPVVFMRAMRGLLYCQYLDGSFSNYAQHSPYPDPQMARSATQHTAWGLAMLAICLRNGKSVLADEPDVLTRGFIARQAAYTNLRERALTDVSGAPAESLFPLRELAFNFGNAGLLTNPDKAYIENVLQHPLHAQHGMEPYAFGLPEPGDSTSPPWQPSTEIDIRSAKK